MSKKTDQDITSIATIAGCIETLRITRSFARIDIKKAMDTCFEACSEAIVNWPLMSNREWVYARRERFKAFIADEPDVGYSALAVIRMCSMLIDDLVEEYDYSLDRMNLLEPIKEQIDKLVVFKDPEGIDFQAYEKADHLIRNFYKIIDKKEFA